MSGLTEKVIRAAVGIGIAGAVLTTCYSYYFSDTVRTRVTDAQMTKVDEVYMIATEYRPFKNEDAWYRFKFDSGTVQNNAIKLKGKEVDITKYGWRWSLFSMYENVVGIEEAKK
ncbi:DUF1523 family protein [Candidatus Woesearchaeota archaeon]|nr:DUF1523 family protein [Candidatus Woesearchaeota archaeon]